VGSDLDLTEVTLNQSSWVKSWSLCFFLPTTAIPCWFEVEALKCEHSTPGLMRHEKCQKFGSVITELPFWEAWDSFQVTLVTCMFPEPRRLAS